MNDRNDVGLDVVGPVVALVVGMFVMVWMALRMLWWGAQGLVWLAAAMYHGARKALDYWRRI